MEKTNTQKLKYICEEIGHIPIHKYVDGLIYEGYIRNKGQSYIETFPISIEAIIFRTKFLEDLKKYIEKNNIPYEETDILQYLDDEEYLVKYLYNLMN